MSSGNFRKEEQPGLEVVPQAEVDRTTAPQTNYVENETSPPPQQFEITSSTHTHPLFRPSSLYDGSGDGTRFAAGGNTFAHNHMHAKELGTDSKTEMTSSYGYNGLTTPTRTMMYPPTESPRNLEENRPVYLPVQEISNSKGGADGNQIQAVEFMKRVPFWRRKRFWIIIGIIAVALVVIGGIVGGVLASQD